MKDRFGNNLKVGDKVHFLGGPSGYGNGIYLGTIVGLRKDKDHRDCVIMECETEVYPNSNVETCSRHPSDVAKAYVGKRRINKGCEMDNDNYTPIAHWTSIEYEYATCSNCGFNEYTDWNSTNEAKEKIKTFHETYRYCPGCGRKMEAPTTRRRN